MSAAVLTFPERNKGRKRNCRGMEAAGLLSLLLLDRDGERIPDNVQRLDVSEGAALPVKSVELLFARSFGKCFQPSSKGTCWRRCAARSTATRPTFAPSSFTTC